MKNRIGLGLISLLFAGFIPDNGIWEITVNNS